MEMRKCEKGHYYDASVHSDCPYCDEAGMGNVGMTMALTSAGSDAGRTMPLTSALGTGADSGMTRPLFESVQQSNNNEGRTVALIKHDMGIDPVVGWMVCVSGKEKGRDYRIHSDNNYVGRSEKMDICIRGDETISRENQAVIAYDAADKTYYFSPGDGRSIVRVNDKAVFQTTELKAYDRVTIGKTVLLFMPLCGEKFEWEKDE